MKHIVRTLIAGLILGLVVVAVATEARAGGAVVVGGYGHGGGHWHGHWHAGGYWPGYGWGWGGYGPYWGVGFAYPYPAYYGYPAYPAYPAYGVVTPSARYDNSYAEPAPEQHAPARPDPQFTPRFGQSAGQTETDRRACNRWATTQPEALADAAEFHRQSLVCMEGRGYVVH